MTIRDTNFDSRISSSVWGIRFLPTEHYFFEDTGGFLKTAHTKYDFPIVNPGFTEGCYGTTALRMGRRAVMMPVCMIFRTRVWYLAEHT